MARGPWCAFMDHDDTLAEDCPLRGSQGRPAGSGLVLVYSDEDKIDGKGRRFEPHFKPDFDRELLYGQNYINHSPRCGPMPSGPSAACARASKGARITTCSCA